VNIIKIRIVIAKGNARTAAAIAEKDSAAAGTVVVVRAIATKLAAKAVISSAGSK
jgi:hypothetical protein